MKWNEMKYWLLSFSYFVQILIVNCLLFSIDWEDDDESDESDESDEDLQDSVSSPDSDTSDEDYVPGLCIRYVM